MGSWGIKNEKGEMRNEKLKIKMGMGNGLAVSVGAQLFLSDDWPPLH